MLPSWRGSRGPSYGRSYRNYDDGHRFLGQGRIERVIRYGDGYRVWLGGWGSPFFVPFRFYDPLRFRLGLFVGFNAFYDPLGYYSVYGWPGYYRQPVESVGVYDRDRYEDNAVSGVVRSVDLVTGVAVLDDRSGRTVSVLLPPRDPRVDEIRPGDYLELSGDWVHGRRYDFDADRMDRFDRGR